MKVIHRSLLCHKLIKKLKTKCDSPDSYKYTKKINWEDLIRCWCFDSFYLLCSLNNTVVDPNFLKICMIANKCVVKRLLLIINENVLRKILLT